MAAYNKFHAFVEHLAEKVHNLGADTLKIYLTNTTPDAAADAVKADLAEIGAGNGYTAGGVTVSALSSAQSGGTYKLVLDSPAAIEADSGTIGPFRYAVLYNDTPSSPADPLIGWWDYGTSITLQDGEQFTISLDEVDGTIEIT